MSDASAAASPLLSRYRARNIRRMLLVVLLTLAALGAVLLDLSSGPAALSLREAAAALLALDDAPRGTVVILREVRLPVAIMALLVGAALALAGAEMQTILENPLAEPFTLGVSSAAAFGASLAIVLGLSLPFLPPIWAVPANAFVFALGALGLLQLLARLRGGGPEVLILFGIALSFTAGALLSLMQLVASADALQQLVFWTMGSLAAVTWPAVLVMALIVGAVTPFSLNAAWRLTALRLGHEQAQSFGVDVRALRRWSLVRVSLLSAGAVSMVGVIGFVGLAGPHIARMLVGEDHRFLLPASLLTGAVLMSLASTAAKLIVPGMLLPIGLVTSLIGLPIFFSLILRGR